MVIGPIDGATIMVLCVGPLRVASLLARSISRPKLFVRLEFLPRGELRAGSLFDLVAGRSNPLVVGYYQDCPVVPVDWH